MVLRAAIVLLLTVVGCNDVRQFHGTWRGPRVGDATVLRRGITADATATLAIDRIDAHGLHGALSVDGLVANAAVDSLSTAEADVISGMTWGGSPLRVYVAFVDVGDGGGSALALVALYEDHRVEVRVLRGGANPLYGIFALAEAP